MGGMRPIPASLEALPNVGPAIAADLRLIRIRISSDLNGKNAYTFYNALCDKTRQRRDPCVLDTFLAAVDFASGAAMRLWWAHTKQRKAHLKQHPEAIRW